MLHDNKILHFAAKIQQLIMITNHKHSASYPLLTRSFTLLLFFFLSINSGLKGKDFKDIVRVEKASQRVFVGIPQNLP